MDVKTLDKVMEIVTDMVKTTEGERSRGIEQVRDRLFDELYMKLGDANPTNWPEMSKAKRRSALMLQAMGRDITENALDYIGRSGGLSRFDISICLDEDLMPCITIGKDVVGNNLVECCNSLN